MKRFICFCVLFLLKTACTPQRGMETTQESAKPTPTTLPSLQPKATEYIPQTPVLPNISPQGNLDLQISAPFSKGTISQLYPGKLSDHQRRHQPGSVLMARYSHRGMAQGKSV